MLSIADYLSLSSAEQDRVFPQLSREMQLPAAELENSFEVLGRAVVPILPGDTPEKLAARVLIAEHRLYPRLLAEYVIR